MDRTQELNTIATVAGLRDLDMLKAARSDLSPEEAVCDLVCRYPGAFQTEQSSKFKQAIEAKRPKLYQHMTPAEQRAFCERHRIPVPLLPVRHMVSQQSRRV
jgi:hypothetical protein